MTTDLTLSIVVPVYNGARSIATLVNALCSLKIEGGHEILLIDDGSRDDSGEICESLVRGSSAVPVTLIKLSRNFGEHNAVIAGLNYVRGKYVITMDDDLQNPPSEVIKLLDFAKVQGYQVVYSYYEKAQHHWFRNLGSRFANWTANVLLDIPNAVYLSSFRCMSAFVAQQVVRYKGPFPYIDGLILQATQSVGAIKLEHKPRVEGKSNYTLAKLVRLWLSIALNFSTIPLRISTILGLISVALSIVLLLLVVKEYLVTGMAVADSGTLLAAILLFSGTQLIMLGIVGEYIGRLYQTTNNRPQFIAMEIIRSGTGVQDI